jgi:versicolorin B desaturase
LTRILRESYAQEEDMDSKNLATIPYLSAVLHESLRMYPSVAGATPRVTPPGGTKSKLPLTLLDLSEVF